MNAAMKSMSRDDGASLVCRLFALYLFTDVLVGLSYLPERVFNLSHTLLGPSVVAVAATADFWTRQSASAQHELIVTATLAIRVVGYLLAGRLFWRAGPRLRAWLLPEQVQAANEAQNA